MKESIHRGINRLIDRFTGFEIDHELEKIMAFDRYSREEIEKYQRDMFRKLSGYAAQADFYKQFEGKPIEEFPLMNREDYVQNQNRLRTHAADVYHERKSSGSTGVPVSHFVTREMLLAKRVSHQKMLHWYGLSRESSEMKMGGAPADIKTRAYYRLRNKRYLNSHLLKKENMPLFINRFNRFKPKVLYGYPSIIHDFVMFAKEQGVKLHEPRLVVTHAENLTDEVKNRIETEYPSASVVNQYWSTEANIAVTCPHGRLHMDEDTVICEVLNQDASGTGDLYITNLYSYAVPLIRYRLGDLVRLSEESCSCGRVSRVIDQIQGRDMDFVDMPDGARYPVTAFHFSEETTNILSFQMLYSKKKSHMIIRYVPRDANRPIAQDMITSYLKKHVGLSVSFEQVEALQRTKGGKTKPLIDLDRETKP